MRRAWIAVIAVAALAIPGVAFAHGDDGSQSSGKNASKLCKALRAEMGVELFRQTYGTNHNHRNALGKCVSKHRHAVKKLIAEAVKECKTQLGANQSRKDKGEDHSAKRAALRECVKQKLQAGLNERREAFATAAKSCDTERTADPAAFRAKYGSNENHRNAFGKCVVKTVRANQAAEAKLVRF
jgi:ribosomal protein L17